MNEMLFRTLLKRYEAVIEDSLYKIQSFNENNIIIPEHIDITGEVDKLLLIIAEAEDKVAIMRTMILLVTYRVLSVIQRLTCGIHQKNL